MNWRKPSWMESCWQVKVKVNIRFVKQKLKKVYYTLLTLKVKEKKNMKVNWRRSSRVESCQVQQSQLWNQLGAKVKNLEVLMIELLPIYTLRITGRRKKSLEARKAQFRQTVDRIIIHHLVRLSSANWIISFFTTHLMSHAQYTWSSCIFLLLHKIIFSSLTIFS